MNEQIIEQIRGPIELACQKIPPKYREDVQQDIYVKLITDLSERNFKTDSEKVEFCLERIRTYKTRFYKKYRIKGETDLDVILDKFSTYPQTYLLTLDIDRIYPFLTPTGQKLLPFIIENGVDVSYNEICSFMGYRHPASASKALQHLLQNLNRLIEDSPGVYDHSKRYLRYKK